MHHDFENFRTKVKTRHELWALFTRWEAVAMGVVLAGAWINAAFVILR